MQSDFQLDVFVGNYTLIDPDIYGLWLSGKNAQDACSYILHQGKKQIGGLDLQTSHICDQYRLFQMMERLLYYPLRMNEQWTFQVAMNTQKTLIERYYEFDCCVVREFLGKKMSSRQRKDLEEVSERSGIPIKSCRRQFDNVKRVFKTVEDCTGDLVQIIQNQFLLSENLARKYAAILYITNNRFETGKRKLHYLTLDDFLYCASQMMLNWSCIKYDCKYEETAMEIDREFLQNLRDAKVVLDKDTFEELRGNIMSSMCLKIADRLPSDLDINLKVISRTLINIANGLNHGKELKDLFIDIVEKIVEPIRHSRWSEKEMKFFLQVFSETVLKLDVIASEPQLAQAWERYMSAMAECIVKMYHF